MDRIRFVELILGAAGAAALGIAKSDDIVGMLSEKPSPFEYKSARLGDQVFLEFRNTVYGFDVLQAGPSYGVSTLVYDANFKHNPYKIPIKGDLELRARSLFHLLHGNYENGMPETLDKEGEIKQFTISEPKPFSQVVQNGSWYNTPFLMLDGMNKPYNKLESFVADHSSRTEPLLSTN